MIQVYTSGVYQPGTTSPDPKIRLIQPYLDIADPTFTSSDLLTLEPPLPPSGTPMNTTIIYDNISYIPYISQVSSTSLITDQFPIDNLRNIYVSAIDNEDPSLASYAIQLIRGKKYDLDPPL